MNRLDELDELLGNYFKNQNSLDVIYDDELESKLQSWAYETALEAVPEKRVLPDINEEWQEGWMHREGGVTDYNKALAEIRQALRIKFNQGEE